MTIRQAMCLLVVMPALAAATGSDAQQPVTRQQAIESALLRGPRMTVAAADVALARAQLSIARSLQNPTVSAEYTKSAPQQHFSAALPLDFPRLRAIGHATSGRRAGRRELQGRTDDKLEYSMRRSR